jgi:hypothetical protein
MSSDDRVDVLNGGDCLRERLGMPDDAPAIRGVDVRKGFPREHVARMQRPDGWEHDERVAVGMTNA